MKSPVLDRIRNLINESEEELEFATNYVDRDLEAISVDENISTTQRRLRSWTYF